MVHAIFVCMELDLADVAGCCIRSLKSLLAQRGLECEAFLVCQRFVTLEADSQVNKRLVIPRLVFAAMVVEARIRRDQRLRKVGLRR